MTSRELETILVVKINTLTKVAEEIAKRYNAISETGLGETADEVYEKLVSQTRNIINDFSETMGCIYAYKEILKLIKESDNE